MSTPAHSPATAPIAASARSSSLAPLLALSGARIKEFFREPGALFWTFGFPLLITVALGIAFRNEGPPRVAVAVVASSASSDAAQVAAKSGTGAARLAAILEVDPGLTVHVLSASEAAARLRTGEVVLTIDPGTGAGGPVIYRFDPSHPDALGARRLVDDRLQRHAGRRDPVPTHDETAVARGARYVDWLVPGLLGMQLLSGALWGTAWNIVNARQRKLLKRLIATPMRKGHYLLSYRISGLLFVPLQVIVLFAFARLTFGVTVHGSALAVLALSFLGSWSFAGLGLLCASRAQNSETANGLVNLVTLPMFVLSGVFFSSARFPTVLQPWIRLLPLSAFNEALRHIVNDGASLFAQGFPVAVLLVWGLAASAVALRLFRWT
jgi:ABC-2 type transport system permease protein